MKNRIYSQEHYDFIKKNYVTQNVSGRSREMQQYIY